MAKGHEANDIERFDDDEHGKDRQFVTALARGLELLRCFGPGERYIGVSELARRTGIPKPTVSRLAGTLSKLGYLNFAEQLGKYQLGSGVLSLGYSMLSNIDVRQVARPLLKELTELYQTSASIAVRDRLSMVYVETVRSSASIALQLGIGARLEVGTSAIGKAYLAACPEAEREMLLAQIRERDPARWPAIKAGIDKALRDCAERGFTLTIGEWNKDINGVGVPFTAPDGLLMAFNCGGPGFFLPQKLLEEEIGPRLVKVVRQIARAMGQP